MGCASSAALPFLTGKGTPAVTESANGKATYDLNPGMNGVKDVAESDFITDRMKDVVDSSAVQGVIGGVMETKDEIVSQVQGAGEAVTGKVSSVVESVEDSIESTMSQVTQKIEDVEEKVKSEVKSIGEKISSAAGIASDEEKEKEAEIDELLASLPEDETEMAKVTTADELIEAATEEVTEDEMKN